MFSLGGNQRIYYCAHPVNLRKSFDGLAGAVQEYIGPVAILRPDICSCFSAGTKSW